ncbi:GNAT family N-acetyltransferase [Photobacterium sp. SDRW27]|uniref:GNAT family N-acetyltransferase n=1 Tax=Photobacterium obscurum TaxID=2829490 RepID=UPI0022442AC5|nr:GNAT family N-acetyltransferase [Photobacterium obscurum]MCW8332188.1 GNAT family N-acetyltransferase [Photobacterium obscurum]
MSIEGNRIILYRLKRSDWPLFKDLYTNPQIMKHVYEPFSDEVAKESFNDRLVPWCKQSDGWLSFSIRSKQTNNKIGLIGLKITNHKHMIAEVGYLLCEQAQGKGFASESLDLIKIYAFKNLNINELTATCSTENVASYRLLEKLGFKRKERLKSNSTIGGKQIDDYIYTCLVK